MKEFIKLVLSSKVLMVNTILLFVLTISAVILLIPFIRRNHMKDFLEYGISRVNKVYNERRLLNQAKKYSGTITIKMNFIEKVEITLIDKSNIRSYLPLFNFYVLVLVSVALFTAAFQPVYRVLYSVASTVVICSLVGSIPFVILEIWGKYNTEKIRRRLANFISVLNRWCAVKEDIIFAFEKSIDSGIGEPLRTYIRDTAIQVKKGLDIHEALELLQMKVDSEQFKDFILNIGQSIKYRGDLRKLLSNMENEFYKLEEEYSRRKISSYKDRFLVHGTMISVLVITYFFLKFNPNVMQFYLATSQGRMLITLFSILYFGAFVLSTRISRFNY